MRTLVAVFAALILASPGMAQQAGVLPTERRTPPAAPLSEAPQLESQAAVGCLGALRGVRTALARGDDAILRLAPGERAVIESSVLAASELAEAGREEICLQIATALTPLVADPDLGDPLALGYAINGIEWVDEINLFSTFREIEGEDLYGPAEEGGDRTALADTELGNIVGAVMRFGQVTHLVVDGEGGLFGIGSETRAIPVDLVRYNLEEDRFETFVEADSFRDRAIVTEENGLWVLEEPVEGGRVRDMIGD